MKALKANDFFGLIELVQSAQLLAVVQMSEHATHSLSSRLSDPLSRSRGWHEWVCVFCCRR